MRGSTLAGMLLLALAGTAVGEPFMVSGTAGCTIYQPADASEARRALTAELQQTLATITGNTIPLSAELNDKGQLVPALAQEFPDIAGRLELAALGPEGVVITTKADPGRLWMLSNSELGLRHAVYRLLSQLGCRWYFPGPVWTIIPRESDLNVELDLREAPAFDHRLIRYGFGYYTPKLREDHEVWLIHNRQLGAFEEQCSHAYDGHIPKSEFAAHPEWFSLVGGERKPLQLCTTHPEVRRRMIASTLATFEKEPERIMVSVEPNDGEGYCECDRCKAVGSVSDNVYELANVVAKAVREKYPDKWVGLFGYAFHSDPPRFPFEPGVYVQVTTGFRYTKLSFEEQVDGYRNLGARVGVYDYFSVYMWDWDIPGASKAGRIYQLAEDIRHYRDLGLSTYNAESSCNWGPNGPGYWIAAQLMWNPDLDAAALMEDFCSRAFLHAAAPMRRLYDRWEHGERFSPRNLKLALLDLGEAYAREEDPAVHARLDRVAMFMHWLRLRTQFTAAATQDQMGGFFAAAPEEISNCAKELIVYSRRLMDTGMIHANPLLFTEWSDSVFGRLKKLEGFDYAQLDAWKTERTDIPAQDEVARDLADDLAFVAPLEAAELTQCVYSNQLVSAAEAVPGAVQAWGDVEPTPLFLESGAYCFIGRQDEPVELAYTPFDGGHTIDGAWMLRALPSGAGVAEGTVKAEKGQPQTLRVTLPTDGLFRFDPGTDYWKAAQVAFGGRPAAVCAARPEATQQGGVPALRLWLPTLEQPLYFFVPKGTKHFVIGLVEGSGVGYMSVIVGTGDGAIVREENKLLPGDQISVNVPQEKAGAIWSLRVHGLRCEVELYGVPPWLARHPRELLIPADAF